MFVAYCPRCDADVLLSYRRLVSVRNTPLGIEVRLACRCGAPVEVLTGASADEPAMTA